MKKEIILMVLIAAAITAGIVFACHLRQPQDSVEVVKTDTLIEVDTLRVARPVPIRVTVVRRDTVWLSDDQDSIESVTDSAGDGKNGVVIPIERKTYEGKEYKAEVEGYQPKLISIEVYPRTVTITQQVTHVRVPRWALTAGLGSGYGSGGINGYVGVSFGYVLWSR